MWDIHKKLKLVANSQFEKILDIARKYSYTDLNVHIEGESGVGKELVARYIHTLSYRNNYPFIAVNCGAIPNELFESEMFGFEKGAFTNAYRMHKGFLEQANGGTVFLDEISELPLNQQVKLLRVLELLVIRRIGGEENIPVDVRFITASNSELKNLVRKKTFRLDLFYRISVLTIHIPPLRDRKEELLPLVYYFISKYSANNIKINEGAIEKLKKYSWPGNIRELEFCIARAVINSDNSIIEDKHIIFAWNDEYLKTQDLWAELEEVLSKVNGKVVSAAKKLGVHRNTIYNKIVLYNLDINKYRR